MGPGRCISSVAVRWACHWIRLSHLQRSRELGGSRDPVIASLGTSGYPWAATGRGVAKGGRSFFCSEFPLRRDRGQLCSSHTRASDPSVPRMVGQADQVTLLMT